MHRKVQVFSMPGKVSIGQDRNKKDPHRGRKRLTIYWRTKLDLMRIEIKKIPIGDGNNTKEKTILIMFIHRNKKDPHRGRKRFFFYCGFDVLTSIEIKKIPIGDGNDFV